MKPPTCRLSATKQVAGLAMLLAGAMLAGCTPGREAGPVDPSGHSQGMPWHGPGMMMGGTGMMGHSSMQRRRQAMMAGIPAPYRGVTDPLPSSPAVIAAGKDLYDANCAVCHGAGGEGDGPAGSGLSPPPANLRALLHSPMARDDYLMWAIGAGGAELGTGMPAFQDALPEDARWKIISFLRTL